MLYNNWLIMNSLLLVMHCYFPGTIMIFIVGTKFYIFIDD